MYEYVDVMVRVHCIGVEHSRGDLLAHKMRRNDLREIQ